MSLAARGTELSSVREVITSVCRKTLRLWTKPPWEYAAGKSMRMGGEMFFVLSVIVGLFGLLAMAVGDGQNLSFRYSGPEGTSA